MEKVRRAEGPARHGFTILVPAHNEGAVIGRTLSAMRESAGDERPHIIVICNGCIDDTAERAREAAPEAEVVELAIGSKALAINEGLDRTSTFPVIVVDADVSIGPQALACIAGALREPEVLAASPAAKMDLTGCDLWTRSYYSVWASHSYLSAGVGGSGVYGLSEAGIRQIGRLPKVIADDTYVRSTIPLAAQRRIFADAEGRPVHAEVQAPRRAAELIKCEARWHSGNVELRRFMSKPGSAQSLPRQAKSEVSKPQLAELMIFYGIKILGRGLYHYDRMRGNAGNWRRDSSRR